MHPVDEFAEIRTRIRALKAREAELRDRFLAGDVALESNRHRIELRTQMRRVFLRDRLPASVLANPDHWEHRPSQIVSVRDLVPEADDPDDIVLVVPFDD